MSLNEEFQKRKSEIREYVWRDFEQWFCNQVRIELPFNSWNSILNDLRCLWGYAILPGGYLESEGIYIDICKGVGVTHYDVISGGNIGDFISQHDDPVSALIAALNECEV